MISIFLSTSGATTCSVLSTCSMISTTKTGGGLHFDFLPSLKSPIDSSFLRGTCVAQLCS
jgi:hypothetical protein